MVLLRGPLCKCVREVRCVNSRIMIAVMKIAMLECDKYSCIGSEVKKRLRDERERDFAVI